MKLPIRFFLIAVAAVCMSAFLGCSKQQFGIASQSQEFGQSVTFNTQVDVLWVIDTSSSMKRHQELLASQMGSFVSELNQTGLNYQIAVTTMDMGASGARGRLIAKAGTPVVLTASSPGLVSILSDRLIAGESGSPVERGLEAMSAALQGALIPHNSNFGFLRPNALLVVVFLTDEEDQSPEGDYDQLLDGLRPPLPYGDRSWLVHVMGVMPNDPSCMSAQWGHSSVAYRYISLAEASGGVAESICDADLRRAVTNMRARILEVMTEYPLGSRLPIVESIKVYVDGKPIEKSTANGWSYLAAKNSIRFHGSAVPKPNSKIKVEYDPAGLK